MKPLRRLMLHAVGVGLETYKSGLQDSIRRELLRVVLVCARSILIPFYWGIVGRPNLTS